MSKIGFLLCATDFPDEARDAAHRGALLAVEQKARLELLHVMSGTSLDTLHEFFGASWCRSIFHPTRSPRSKWRCSSFPARTSWFSTLSILRSRASSGWRGWRRRIFADTPRMCDTRRSPISTP